ncbi:MAG: hypothetical protein CVU84_12275 [Firmicutes bacterium HGW-Firmicutes-1]|jgi:hypothetical protein|nr:MAG: hypothetical protein CVU84_12275 [Firmicutes bacterium HGW-Firmicutes-1]
MKRLLCLILCLSFVLAGCKDKYIEPVEEPLIAVTWANLAEYKNIEVPYIPVAYEAKVLPYTIESDLSNIENIDMFSGFSQEQINMLVDNGFVVLPSNNTKLHYTYDANEYLHIPNFVTTDSVLHMYHQFYDKSLAYIEGEFLADDLKLLTDSMLKKSIKVNEAVTDTELTDLTKENIVFFLVAKMLLAGNSYVSKEYDSAIVEIAKKEYNLIQEAEGYVRSPLFDKDLDYSQFRVRGHYTKSAEYERFFKTMMWYGFASMPLMVNEGKGLDVENAQKAILMTYSVFVDGDQDNTAKLWNSIYEPTGFYVGLSDDLNFFDLKDVLIKVFGENPEINAFADKQYYGALFEEIRKLRNPKINSKITQQDTAKGKQFRFMGQRYVLDSYILQELMEPILRPVPTGLDVMGTMGSLQAEKMLFEDMKPQEQWPKYETNYNEIKNEISKYEDSIWQSNLYNGWLWTIKASLKEYDETSNMPYFMMNEAWSNKSLNTALGSYTELKHDTVLYGKQAAAEMGGPIDYADQHYVEPNVELYSKLLWLMQYSTANLEARGLLNEDLLKSSKEYITILELLVNCSVKELNNEPLTKEEKDKLLWYGGTLESISNGFYVGSIPKGEDIPPAEKSGMLVTDVATIGNGNLSMGTGFFDEIYVVVPVEGKLYLSRGSVYSFYEFVSDTRLTDQEWWALNGLIIKSEEYGDVLEFAEPSVDLPKQPYWVETFKTNTNELEIDSTDIDWDELNE